MKFFYPTLNLSNWLFGRLTSIYYNNCCIRFPIICRIETPIFFLSKSVPNLEFNLLSFLIIHKLLLCVTAHSLLHIMMFMKHSITKSLCYWGLSYIWFSNNKNLCFCGYIHWQLFGWAFLYLIICLLIRLLICWEKAKERKPILPIFLNLFQVIFLLLDQLLILKFLLP